jgi:RNA polymerase sigma-70 factor (sigma-E family)
MDQRFPLLRTDIGADDPANGVLSAPATFATVDGAAPGAASIRQPSAEVITFEQLYKREYDPMLRIAYLLVGSEGTAEEIVQDAFVRVHSRFSRLDSPGGYLRTCVVNGCRDRLRRRGLFTSRIRILGAAPVHEVSPATDHADLYHSLMRLPRRQRAAVVLRFYEGWTDADIAAAIDVRPGTVKSLVHRGLAALRKEITP